MLDRRQSARDKVIYGGVAEIGETGATRDCVVRNISESGARIEFSNVIKIPKEQMSLTIARKGRSFLARVIWWRDNFVGVAFRLQKDPLRYECFYLRPTNGRADDQLRRNHSTQYVSHPDHPWHRLRKESPGVYESYVDLVPGEWTRVKIVVAGTTARLYVHGAEQPSLIVNDLKLGASEGTVALWIGPGTEAHFANLRVEPHQP